MLFCNFLSYQWVVKIVTHEASKNILILKLGNILITWLQRVYYFRMIKKVLDLIINVTFKKFW